MFESRLINKSRNIVNTEILLKGVWSNEEHSVRIPYLFQLVFSGIISTRVVIEHVFPLIHNLVYCCRRKDSPEVTCTMSSMGSGRDWWAPINPNGRHSSDRTQFDWMELISDWIWVVLWLLNQERYVLYLIYSFTSNGC